MLGAPGNYHLTGDLGPCTGHGVVISASDVHFTLAGFTITGVSSETCDINSVQIGIAVNSLGQAGVVSDVRITGGTVTGFGDGIHLNFTTASRVHRMAVTDHCVFGIAIGNSSFVRVDHSVVSGNGLDGIAIGRSHDVTIRSNDVVGNFRIGIEISDFADGNTIRHNLVSDNGLTGGGGGIVIFNGQNNVIRDNAVDGNLGGIGVTVGNAGTVVRGNTANGNAQAGISIVGTDTTVSHNTARGNGIVDLQDTNPACDANTWTHNRFVTDIVAFVPDGGPRTGCIR